MIAALVQDFRFGLRMLRKSPAFTIVAVLTLALGIGANTAIFSVVKAVLLEPLPYDHPEQLVRFRSQMSWPDMQDVAAQAKSFSVLGGYNKNDLDFTQQVPAERVNSSTVTASMLPMLGIQPELGRWFRDDEAKPGGAHLVMLSHGFWQSHLGGDPKILGSQISFSGASYTVIGVMPAGFQLPEDDAQVWTLLPVEYADVLPFRGAHVIRAYGRLNSGVSLGQAQSELDTVAQRLTAAYPVENTGTRFIPFSLHDYEVRDYRTGLLLLLGAVGLVLLIACVNIANLMLTRSSGRHREIAVRIALGAGRLQLVRQFLAESVLIALLGGVVGLLLAIWLNRLVLVAGAQAISRLDQAQLDAPVLAFNFGLALLTACIFGLAPALSAAHERAESLKTVTSTGGVKRRRLRTLLVASEVAMALVLLVTAGLLMRSFQHLLAVSPGFNPDHLLTARLALPMKQYRDIAKRTVFFEQVQQRLQSVPGVTAVAGTTELPFGSNFVAHNLIVGGRPPVPQGTEPEIYYRGITPSYFQTMQIQLLKGRGFNSADRAGTQDVAIINQAMARQLFPEEDPLGKQIRWAREEKVRWITIVGVAADVHAFGLTQPDEPAVYVPFTQEQSWWRTWMTFVLRSDLPPADLEKAVRESVAQVDRNIAVAEVSTMDELMDNVSANRRFQLMLFGLFAILALLLAAVGTYGVVSYLVSQRTREIGVRIAIGAQKRDVMALVLRDGISQVLLGMVAGIAASLALSRYLSSLLFQTPALDLPTFAGVSLLLLAVALLASYIPARRATKVDPMVALRYE